MISTNFKNNATYMLRNILVVVTFLLSSLHLCSQCDNTHPDYQALMALYNSTDGANWTNNDGWIEGAAGESCDPCNFFGQPWFGIECQNNTVITIGLQNNELTGKIPKEISGLSIERLDLSINNLTEEIPIEISKLTNLELLYLDRNKLVGQIPIEISQLVNLKFLDLSLNQLSGKIPIELSSLLNLQLLRLRNNNLSGCFPEALCLIDLL